MLFELATEGPGFAVDEDRAHLGESLVLPPWLEPERAAIEGVLPKLADAIVAVRAGKGEVKAEGTGKAIHAFQGFKFLLAEPAKGLD